jgi:hypothetical protein
MFQPTRLDIDLRIKFWYVRFDVKQWSAVDNVHILDVWITPIGWNSIFIFCHVNV